MTLNRALLCIALCIGACYGVTVVGVVVDTGCSQPLSGVVVKFPFVYSVDAFPKTVTDSSGRVSRDLTIEQGYLLQPPVCSGWR
jgi:hypothetical protein